MARKCPVCDTILSDWADTCGACGQPLGDEETQPTVQLPRLTEEELRP